MQGAQSTRYWFVLTEDRNTHGPFETEQVRRDLFQRVFPVTVLVCLQGGAQWQPAMSVAEFADIGRQLGVPAPPPPDAKGAKGAKGKWYHSAVVVAVTLILFFPLGLVLLWTAPNASMGAKIGVSVLIAILTVYAVRSKERPEATATSASAPAFTTPAPAPVAIEPLSATVSIANFTKDNVLDECDDFTITLPPGVDAGTALEDGFANFVKGKKGMSRLGKRCGDQFRTNPALASCTMHSEQVTKADSGIGAGLRIVIDLVGRYYNLDTITKSDTYMKNCLDLNGDWQAADKDSDEYREAVRARARREVEKAQRALEKMQGSISQ
jgi:uncharacterized protein DUF4339